MKNTFETLKAADLSTNELQQKVYSLADKIVATDSRLVSVRKERAGYGTWKTVGFANEYHFGSELAALIIKGLSGKITHNEEEEFTVSDLRDDIAETIFSAL